MQQTPKPKTKLAIPTFKVSIPFQSKLIYNCTLNKYRNYKICLFLPLPAAELGVTSILDSVVG